MSELQDVKAFQEKFGIYMPNIPSVREAEVRDFRGLFLEEEVQEYRLAANEENLTKMFDALIDIVYVALGTALLHGMPWKKGWKIVHQCNMRKQRAQKKENSTREYEFDVIKPEGWKPPEVRLAKVLLKQHKICTSKGII